MSHKVSYKVKENSIYTRIQGILQELGILLEGCLTVKNQWGLLTGDDGRSNTVSVQQNQPKNQQSWGIEFGSANCTSSTSAPYPELVIAATICSGVVCSGSYQTNPSVKLIFDAVTPSRPERDDFTIATQPPQVSPLRLNLISSCDGASSCDKTGVVSIRAIPRINPIFRMLSPS